MGIHSHRFESISNMQDYLTKGRGNRLGNRYSVELAFENGSVLQGVVTDEPTDGVGIICPCDDWVTTGSEVIVVKQSLQRTGIVHHFSRCDGEALVGIQWKSASYRDRARRLFDGSGACSEFSQSLPFALYSLWKLFDSGRRDGLFQATDQLIRSAKQVGIPLDDEYRILRQASYQNDEREARRALTELCENCLSALAGYDPGLASVQRRSSAISASMHATGVPVWVLGMTVCMALRLVIIN